MLQRFKKAITWIVLASMLLTNSIPSSMALADEYAEGSGYEQTVVEDSSSETVTEPAGENQGGSAPVEQTEDPSTPENASSGDQNNADASNNQQDATPEVSENGNEPTQTDGTPATTTEGEAQNTEGTEGKTPDATEGDGVTEQPAEDVKKEEEPTGETQPAETPVEESKQEEPKQENNPGQEETKTEESKTEETPSQTSDTPSATGSQTPTESSTPAESSTATESSAPVEENKVEGPVSDDTADVETAEDWAASVQSVPITGDWGKDLVATAKSQLGYTESTKNFRIDADGTVRGYNRYAAWAGVSPYEDWCTLFVLFCLRNAEIPEDAVKWSYGVKQWIEAIDGTELYHKAGDSYTPKEGDLVFFVDEEELAATGNRVAGHVGIVSSVSTDEAGNITSFYAIEGNNNNAVRQVSYGITETKIFGFGVMPENPALKAEEPAAEEPAKEEEPVAQPEVQEEPKLQKKMQLKAAPPLRAEGDGEGEEDPNKWPKPLKDRADNYYGTDETPGIKQKVFVYVSGPEDSANDTTPGDYYAGETVRYHITYGLDQADNWPDPPYSGTMSLYDSYYDITVTVKLPAGLLLKGAGDNWPIDKSPANDDPSVEHTYTIHIPSNEDEATGGHVPALDTVTENFWIDVYIGNNGKDTSIHEYILDDMATVSAKWDVVNKLLDKNDENYVVGTYSQSATKPGTGFETKSPDVWGVRKTIESGTFNSDTNEVTFIWKVDVGFKTGEDPETHKSILETNQTKYSQVGRDGITSFKLTDTLDTILSKTGLSVDPESVKIKRSDDSSEGVDLQSEIVIWGTGASNALMMNSVNVDSNGNNSSSDSVDAKAPSFTTYIITAVYKVTSDMIADFSDNVVYNLNSTNEVASSAKLAEIKELQEDDDSANKEVPLLANSPASIKVIKYLVPYEGAKTEYNNEYGTITYTLSATDNSSITVYKYENERFEVVGTGTSIPVTVGPTYYVAAGKAYRVTETIDPSHSTEMKPENGVPYVESEVLAQNELWTGEINNKELKGKIRIRKVDAAHTTVGLPGAEFTLTYPDGTTKTLPTNNSGYVTFEDLPFGTYLLDETKAPDGYEKPKDGSLPMTIKLGDGEGETNIYYGDNDIVIKNTETKAWVELTKYVGIAQTDPSTFPKATNSSFASFTLQRTTVENPTEDDWEPAKDYQNNAITTTLNSQGQIRVEVPSAAPDGTPYKYRFKEEISNTAEYYPVIEYPSGTFTDNPNATVSTTPYQTVAAGSTASFSLYNRRYIRINVNKNYYSLKSDGTIDKLVDKTSTAEFGLYYYDGVGAPSSADDLQKIGTNKVAGYQGDNNTEATTATWDKLLLISPTGSLRTYYIKEEKGKEGFIWNANTNQDGVRVRIPDNDSGEWYVKIKIDSNTTSTGFTTLQTNIPQIIPVRIIKQNSKDNTYNISNCFVTIYTDEAMTQVAIDAVTGKAIDGRDKNNNGRLYTGASGRTFFLEEGKIYYYREEIVADGYHFKEADSDSTSTTIVRGGVIDLRNVTQPDLINATTSYKAYTIKNEPDPVVKISKKSMGQQTAITGAKFAVYVKDGNSYVPYKNADGVEVVFDLSSATSASKSLPAGTYFITETQVPSGYLNPNSANACAEYNRVAALYHRKLISTKDITYFYDSASGKTFTQIDVSDATKEFTFYNIYLKEKVQVQKTVDQQNVQIAGFMIYIYRTDGNGNIVGEAVKSGKTGNNGIAQFKDLDVYDENGERIIYMVKEGDPSTWTSPLNDQYYLVSDGQTFKLEVQTSSTAYNTKDLSGNTLVVDNSKSINITGTKFKVDGWQYFHGGVPFAMEGVSIGLYRRTVTVSGDETVYSAWTYVDQKNTDSSGNVSFTNLKRADENGLKYEYALVELNSNDPTYFPFNPDAAVDHRFDWTYPSGTGDQTSLDNYNSLVLTADKIVANTVNYTLGEMYNSNHWVQFHLTKYQDGHSMQDNIAAGVGDSQGHRRVSDAAPGAAGTGDTLLDDCVYSLYRAILSPGSTTIEFVRPNEGEEEATWKLIGTYSSGSLLDNNGNPISGQLLTDIDTGVNNNYVYVMVEENPGPNSVIINPHYKYTFWYASDHSPVTCTVNGNEIEYVLEYELDKINYEKGLNSWKEGPGTSNILLAALRIAKWRDTYDENGKPKQKYEPLSNAQFELRMTLADGKTYVISELTSGLDGNQNVALAMTGVFQLILPHGDIVDASGNVISAADSNYYLTEYESEGAEHGIRHNVTGIVETLTDPDHPNYHIYGIPVDLYEIGAPDGYGYFTAEYKTYLVFVDKAPNTPSGSKFRFYSDLYFVKTTDKTIQLAHEQEHREWYVTDNDLIEGEYDSFGSSLRRIVDYPMVNTPVEIVKVGYVPTSSTIALANRVLTSLADSDASNDIDYSHEIESGDYGAVRLGGITMKLQRLNPTTDKYEDWDYSAANGGDWGTKTFVTDAHGEFFFTQGLPMGTYRVYETSLGDNTSYENAYDSKSNHYREFTVGGVGVTVYMANPKKVDLTIVKKNMATNQVVTGMTFKLGSLTAAENPTGTYTFKGIPTGKYKLTESAPANSNISVQNFNNWFAATYPTLAGLVSDTGMTIGFTYNNGEPVGPDGNKDVVITAISPWDATTSTPIIQLEVKNPQKSTIKIRKYGLDDPNTTRSASFDIFYLPFSKLSGSIIVPLPDIPATANREAARGLFDNAGWTWVQFDQIPQVGRDYSGKEPGVYAFFEWTPPTGYDRLIIDGKVVLYTAVVTGGLPVNVTVSPSSVDVPGYANNPVKTSYSSLDGNEVATEITVKAYDPKKATFIAKKEPVANELAAGDIGNWSITLNIYETATATTPVGSATIRKGENQDRITFKNGSSDAYFTVGKTYYLEEVVNVVNSTYVDSDHFIWVSYQIDDQTPVTVEPGKRYPISPESASEFTITAKNQYLYGRVDFWKYDQTHTQQLSGAEFVVKYKNGNDWIAVPGAKVEETNVQGHYKAIIPLVNKGVETEYRIYETKAPDDYVKDPNPDESNNYVKVNLSGEHNVKDFTIGTPETFGFIENVKGSKITVYKHNNIYGAADIDYALEDSAKFSVFHWNDTAKSWEIIANQYVTYYNEGTEENPRQVTKMTILLTPYERYAIAETWFDETQFNGLHGIFLNNVQQSLTDINVGGNIYQAVVISEQDSTKDLTFHAYNIPYLKPEIIKVDVGGFPTDVKAIMKYNIYEIPTTGYDVNAVNVKDLVDNCTNVSTDSLPRLVFSNETTSVDTTWIDSEDGTTYTGTKKVWESESDLTKRWDPSKRYVLVEVEVGARNYTTYDTMVKDDPRVTWYYEIKPVPQPSLDPTKPEQFVLKNINSIAEIKLTKDVVVNSENSESDAVKNGSKYEVETLLSSSRNVVYTLKPEVKGANQMLQSFELEDYGLTGTPNVDYEIKKITVGTATQLLPEKLGITEADIHADIIYTTSSGIQKEEYIDVSSETTDESRTFTAPAGTTAFKIVYYSRGVYNASNQTYYLGEQFNPKTTTVYVEVKQIPEGSTASPSVEITDFTNTAKATLSYPKWGKDGSDPIPVTKDAESDATVYVNSIKLPVVRVDKMSDDEDKIGQTGQTLLYTITVTNLKNSKADFENPVLVDILPTGVVYAGLPDNPVSNEEFTLDEITPITGDMVQKVKMPGGQEYVFADAETAVVFRLTGALKPDSSFTISFYAKINDSAVLYERPNQAVSIRNDVYLSSTKHSYYTEDNINGYSFAVSDGTDGYVFGDSLADSAGPETTVPGIHFKGVEGDLTNDKDENYNYTGNTFVWVSGSDELRVVKASRLTMTKAVQGDRDDGFHDSGLGVATRTNSTPGKETEGWVKWRLQINNGYDDPVEDLVIGDVIPKEGDDEEQRHSHWDVIFDQIEAVSVNGTGTDDYILYLYTGEIGGAQGALEEALLNVRSWDDPADHGWYTALPQDMTKEDITAFLMVFNNENNEAEGKTPVILQAGHSAVITYNSTVKDYKDDTDFNEKRAFQNCTNLFCAAYKGYPKVITSKAVSVTLLDTMVEIQGDVWIDEDWDNKQQATHNRRDYSQYDIVKLLANSITFQITDKRKDAHDKTWSEDDIHGVNQNPGYGESVRHFTFTELNPAVQINTPLYITKDGYEGLVLNAWGNLRALKGDDPFFYELKARITDSTGIIAQVFGLTGLGETHYMSDDPVLDLTESADNSLDDNFYPDGGNYKTHPFYIRYSDNVDQSKDIGFRSYRGLEITKVAQDNSEVLISGAKFKIYGPFGDSEMPQVDGGTISERTNTEIPSDDTLLEFYLDSNGIYHLVRKDDNTGKYYLEKEGTELTAEEAGNIVSELTTVNGKIHVEGLNWWKEYDIQEVEASNGYQITGAEADGGEVSRVTEMNEGIFTLKVPAPSKQHRLIKSLFRIRVGLMSTLMYRKSTNPMQNGKKSLHLI